MYKILNENIVCVVCVHDVVGDVCLCDVKIDSKIIKISNNSKKILLILFKRIKFSRECICLREKGR